MVEIIPAQTIELHDLIKKFGLQRIEDEQFFREWQDNLPELTDVEKQALDEVKRELGLTVEQIAQALELDIEEVRKAAQPESSN